MFLEILEDLVARPAPNVKLLMAKVQLNVFCFFKSSKKKFPINFVFLSWPEGIFLDILEDLVASSAPNVNLLMAKVQFKFKSSILNFFQQ